MPEWIHNRAEHILAKNPDMSKSQAFAIATQQSHATGHTPKSYGTPTGKHVAKEKYDTPKDDTQTANPGKLESPKMASAFAEELHGVLGKIASRAGTRAILHGTLRASSLTPEQLQHALGGRESVKQLYERAANKAMAESSKPSLFRKADLLGEQLAGVHSVGHPLFPHGSGVQRMMMESGYSGHYPSMPAELELEKKFFSEGKYAAFDGSESSKMDTTKEASRWMQAIRSGELSGEELVKGLARANERSQTTRLLAEPKKVKGLLQHAEDIKAFHESPLNPRLREVAQNSPVRELRGQMSLQQSPADVVQSGHTDVFNRTPQLDVSITGRRRYSWDTPADVAEATKAKMQRAMGSELYPLMEVGDRPQLPHLHTTAPIPEPTAPTQRLTTPFLKASAARQQAFLEELAQLKEAGALDFLRTSMGGKKWLLEPLEHTVSTAGKQVASSPEEMAKILAKKRAARAASFRPSP